MQRHPEVGPTIMCPCIAHPNQNNCDAANSKSGVVPNKTVRLSCSYNKSINSKIPIRYVSIQESIFDLIILSKSTETNAQPL